MTLTTKTRPAKTSSPLTPVMPPEGAADRKAALRENLRRFPASTFRFDPRMARGWLSDRYFVRTARTMRHAGVSPHVTMQVFAKHDGVFAGAYEAIRMLETQLAGSGRGRATVRDLEIMTLLDGDAVRPWEPVMHIRGPLVAFTHLETPYLGVLARRTLVASNVRRAIDAANGKPVIYMGARHDDWRVQTPDGYAAIVGGASAVSSDAGGEWWGARGYGTMPHAMIAAFDGDTVEATLAFTRYVRDEEPDVRVITLVDYENDAVGTSLAVARALRDEFGPGALSGVRVDTSEKLMDAAIEREEARFRKAYPKEKLTGVSLPLVVHLRRALDDAGFPEVGIYVSGGFTPKRISRFEEIGAPVAGYGVGSSLLGHNHGDDDGLLTGFDFTADVVEVDGRPESKIGRELRPNPRLVPVDTAALARSARRATQSKRHA